jgi:hypothetical protein
MCYFFPGMSNLTQYKRLLTPLQDVLPFAQELGDVEFHKECLCLINTNQITAANNQRMKSALQRIWPRINKPSVSSSLQRFVYNALDGDVPTEPWERASKVAAYLQSLKD